MAILDTDPDGSAAKGVKGTPKKTGARFSKNFTLFAVIVGMVLLTGILVGILTSGPSSKQQDANEADQGVGAVAYGGAQPAPAAPESAPHPPARLPSAPLATLPPQQPELTPAEKYRRWLIDHHYKSLEGRVLAAQSAQLAQIGIGGVGGALQTSQSARAPVENPEDPGLRRISGQLASAESASNRSGASAPSLMDFLHPPPQPVQNQQDTNMAFLHDQSGRTDAGYLPSVRQPALGQHELFAGAVIPAVMLTGIDSDLPGAISAQVRQTVYDSLNPDVVLIPQGTRLIGEYSSEVAYGQSRVLVAWSRLIFPNGATINLRGMEGTDGEGRAGFHDQVDNHYFRVFGSAILMSLLGVGAQLSQPQNSGALNTPSAGAQAAAAIADQANNVGTNLLNRNLNIQPTLVIRPGYAFNVLVNRTMILPPYGGR